MPTFHYVYGLVISHVMGLTELGQLKLLSGSLPTFRLLLLKQNGSLRCKIIYT